MKGKFIAIEGPDGSGKGTQKELLAQRLQSQGTRVFTVDFPQYETSLFGNLVGEILSGKYGDIENIHPRILSPIYAADRWKAAPAIAVARRKGNIVIVDRYKLSNDAHQSARLPKEERPEFLEYLEELEYSIGGFDIPKPDLNIFLNVPIEITRDLVEQKAAREYLKGKSKDQLEANIEHQMEAAKMYKYLAATRDDIVQVDCTDTEGKLLDRETISDRIFEHVTMLIDPELSEGKINKERE